MVGQTDRAVDHEQRDVGAVDGAHRANEAVVLHVLVDLAFAAQARRVNDAVLLAVVDDHRVDGVARGARHVRDDGAVVVGEAIGERGLARVRAADDGDVDDVLVVFFILEAAIDFAQVIDNLVEQIARAMAVRGGDGERVAQAQLVEFPQLIELVGGVELVDREQHRLGGLAQDARDFLVVGVDAGLAVHDEDDHVGLVGRLERLRADGALELVLGAHLNAAGVDQLELDAVPVSLVVRTVARDAAHLVHDSLVGLGDSIDERGFAHVRAANDRNDW